ncbi:rab GTPase-binding effector protein 1-like [Panonychus citri]|uniref:rab GTPase-binding effector protein 1-like n=1 Tax=Panonychus citri TaxID=50023 RepID=UPI0023070668|nr:rab GTPase-binding effector protein 1-like [Panonychus citri]
MLQRSQSLNLYDGSTGEAKSLTDELERTKEKLRKPCEMCSNYEMQLQSMQKNESDLLKQLADSEGVIKSRKDDLRREEAFRTELEEKFAEEAKEIETQINTLKERFDSSAKELAEIRNILTNYYAEASEKIISLTSSKEEMNRHIQKLAAENELLLGKHIAKSDELQSEIIDLPQKMDDMQFYCLKLREDLITALVAKERKEETYRSEILFLKEQNRSEQQSKETMIQELTEDNDRLRTSLELIGNKYKKLKEQHADTSSKLNDDETLLKENTRIIINLEQEVLELNGLKIKLEEENLTLKSKVQSLQNDLHNSEQVQKDFVKLSQSLQIQLEKIRQADTEVRWQHEEDINECNNCKKLFHSRKEKHHCSHCGKIFCFDCNSKTIYGGPKNRSFKVCNVCHTLLDRETAPYFSNEPPQSPT